MPQLIPDIEKNITQAYGITVLDKKHRLVKKLSKHYAPSVHGHKTWLSSFLMMDYLLHTSLLEGQSKLMELGAGWGPLSIFCAQRKGLKVTAVDCDAEVFPFLEVQATLNGVSVKTKKRLFEKLSKSDLLGYDLLLAADVCFWEELVDTHKKLIKRAFNAGVKEIIFADPGRSTFLKLVDYCTEKYGAECIEWYSVEPDYFEGFILRIKAPK